MPELGDQTSAPPELVDGEDAIEFLSSVLKAIPAFVTRVDARFRIRYINRTVPGVTRREVIGTDVFSFVAPEYHAVARACFERVQRTGQADQYESVAGTAESTAYYVNHVSPVHDRDGSTGLCIVGIDVTTDRVRERALQAGRDKLRLVADATGMGLWEWDLATQEVVWDARMLEITGQTRAMDMPRFLEQCVHPEDRAVVSASSERALREGSFSGVVSRVSRPDGSTVWIMSSGIVTSAPQGKPIRMVGACVDVTAQRRTEEELLHAQKLQGLGTLTAGIAHNFNNLLMIILPALELLAPDVRPANRSLLDNAVNAAERAADLVKELLAFAGQKSSYVIAPHDVASLVVRSVGLAWQTFGPHIRVRTHVEPVPQVRCDDGAIEQVLLNILMNARDALASDGGGEPVVDVSVAPVRREHPAGSPRGTRTFVVITVRDRGVGMDEHTRSQMFEPFFTTKAARGTGLGLSTSYAIVREHGGWIECDSAPGAGTEMRIFLPVHEAGAEVPAVEVDPSLPRVLVVDDEASIRSVVARALGSSYHVECVASAEEVAELLTRGERFDVCLVDYSMPGESGSALIPRLRAAMPEAALFYFTGASGVTSGDVDGIIHKPVSVRELNEKIAPALKRG